VKKISDRQKGVRMDYGEEKTVLWRKRNLLNWMLA